MYDEDKLTETRKETSDQQPGINAGNKEMHFNFSSVKAFSEEEHTLSHILEKLIQYSHYHSS